MIAEIVGAELRATGLRALILPFSEELKFAEGCTRKAGWVTGLR